MAMGAIGGCALPMAGSSANGPPTPAPNVAANVIMIQSEPTNADVVVKTSSGEILGSGVTPFRIHAHCYDTAVVTVSAPGYAPATIMDKPAPSSGACLLFLCFGLPETSPPKCHTLDIVNATLLKEPVKSVPHVE